MARLPVNGRVPCNETVGGRQGDMVFHADQLRLCHGNTAVMGRWHHMVGDKIGPSPAAGDDADFVIGQCLVPGTGVGGQFLSRRTVKPIIGWQFVQLVCYFAATVRRPQHDDPTDGIDRQAHLSRLEKMADQQAAHRMGYEMDLAGRLPCAFVIEPFLKIIRQCRDAVSP